MSSSRYPDSVQLHRSGVAVIGEFDGMHRGHVKLVDAALLLASRRNSQCSALVIRSDDSDRELLSIRNRCDQLVTSGVHRALAIQRVDKSLTGLSTQIVDLFRQYEIGIAVLACVNEYSTQRSPSLRNALRGSGVEVVEVPRVLDREGRPITTTLIRTSIQAGDVNDAALWLGTPHRLQGTVQDGDHRGRTIGFATANVHPSQRDVVPAEGVYAAWVDVGDERWPAAVNVGRRPTFYSDRDVLIEAHLIGFAGDLYGAQLSVSFVDRLRAERRFGGIDDLVEQLRHDVDDATKLLGDR